MFIPSFFLFLFVPGSVNSFVNRDPDVHPYTLIGVPDIDDVVNPEEKDGFYWRKMALGTLKKKLDDRLNKNVAKNIVFFLGDGMSIPTLAAARIYKGQLRNATGEEEELSFERFPYTGLSKTYSVDKQVSDSACTATAYLTGVKANFQTIGVTAKVKVGDCKGAKMGENQVSSIAQWAQDAGKATGIVTTTRVTHASPAGNYAHVPLRDMECDADLLVAQMDQNVCNYDIATQLIRQEPGRNFKVILGGGWRKFLPKSKDGERLDGKNLIEEWLEDKKNRGYNASYLTTLEELQRIDAEKTDYLLGLFAPNHMNFHLKAKEKEPSLESMTRTAIEMLRTEKRGFYLFVEGGNIDWAHHNNWAKMALDETVELSKAVQAAMELTSQEDTLIVVTADHSHVMTFNGYPQRGNAILGFFNKATDNKTYHTLSYANGPGYRVPNGDGRHDIQNDDTQNVSYRFPAMVPKLMESHGGDDVAVFARGPWAHLFSGNYEQNYIPIAEAFAAGIGPAADNLLEPSAFNKGSVAKGGCSLALSISLAIFSAISER